MKDLLLYFLILTMLLTCLLASTFVSANGTYDMAKLQGCESGQADTGAWGYTFNKDIDRYIKDAYYKAGWDDGYKRCNAEAVRINQIITDSLNRGW